MTNSQPIPNQHLATLYEITRRLNSSLDLSDVLNFVMDRVLEVTGAERGFLMLRDDETGLLNFRVARGLDIGDLEKPKFQVSRTIVNMVAESGEAVLTDNAQTTFGEHQSVVMMALRSIICVPIKVRDRILGVVYVDNRIHTSLFDEQHLDLLNAFASQAGTAIENARLYEIAIEQGRMQRELEMAHNIQLGLLPTEFAAIKGYDIAVSWDSAREVAGDFYDCFTLDDGTAMGVVIADVSGKGAPAAIFMAVARSLIRGNATAALSPDDMLRQANRLIMADSGNSGMFVTVYYTVFQAAGRVSCVNAGHNQPIWWHQATEEAEWLPRGGRALGWFDDLPVEQLDYVLEVGDMLIFYTDGIVEAEDMNHDPFGEARLLDAIAGSSSNGTPNGVRDAILAAVDEFVGVAPPFDDRTLVIVQYTGDA